MDKNSEIVKKMVGNRLNEIVRESNKIAEMFGKKGVSFGAWGIIIKSAKADPGDEGFPKLNREFFEGYNNTLDSIEQGGVNFATNNDETIVPVEFIEMTIEEVKTNFFKGMAMAYQKNKRRRK